MPPKQPFGKRFAISIAVRTITQRALYSKKQLTKRKKYAIIKRSEQNDRSRGSPPALCVRNCGTNTARVPLCIKIKSKQNR